MKSRAWAVAFAAVLLAGDASAAAPSSPPLWQDVDESTLDADGGERLIVPTRYRVVAVDRDALLQTLATAPLEFTSDAATAALAVELALPMPDGSFSRFRVEESPIMEPGLAQRVPDIRTYRGQGLDDPSATTRFGWTSAGFHAIVLSERGTVYIDPYRRGDTVHSISYFKRDLRRTGEPFRCLVEGIEEHALAIADETGATVPSGDILRTYRLAVATTVEYSDFHSAAVPPDKLDVLNNGIIPTMNRVNGVYERDVAVRMVLVANELDVIFVVEPDGYANNSGDINVNQTIIDGIIGFPNYDIGHVFSTGGGGVAQLRVPCGPSKARGVTGRGVPIGDPFDIDYVAHEMGHQFGGNHSFNGNAGSCNGGRNGSTAYEVGSGSTIMAYAGICPTQDLQPNSDDYFHNVNFVEIQAFITNPATGDACPVRTGTGNRAPAVDAGVTFNIPSRTPFALTASGSDPDGDPLTYCWEEFDLGAAGAGTIDDGSAPILRSFTGTSSPTRTFPKLSDILGNVTTYGEILPTTNRTMKFRVTARDNRAGGGGVEWDETQVTVSASAGPFKVTAPNTSSATWYAGATAVVTWDRANTHLAPISTANVTILLSTNGGLTFPTVLTASTPNDGTQAITVPAVATSTARVKIQAFGNVFFDVSDASFTISTAAPPVASPAALTMDAAGNQVLQPAEIAIFAPTWRNTGSTFIGAGTGSISSFTGPTPASYTMFDVSGSYGSMVPGASSTCAPNCYSLRVNILGGVRPVQHWDATVEETTTLGTGTVKTWTLHVGGSFGDVPSTHSFYREVETLLHQGVTSGCATGSYCPGSAVTRAQMAVFLLRSKEGGAYAPPPCTAQEFDDVPCSLQFAEWINELAARNVTQGCIPGSYCPGASVTRGQMAKFLLATLEAPGYEPPACTTQRFDDVPCSYSLAAWVNELAGRNITSGCSATAYCPNDSVTRAQMAAFLTRTFGLLLYGP